MACLSSQKSVNLARTVRILEEGSVGDVRNEMEEDDSADDGCGDVGGRLDGPLDGSPNAGSEVSFDHVGGGCVHSTWL